MSSEQKPGTGSGNTSVLSALLPHKVIQWIGAALVFGAVAAVGGFVVTQSGVVNLSAVPPHPPGWAHFLHYTMQRSVAHHAHPRESNEPLDSPAMVMRGATHYALVCANCHGAPGYGQSPVALSLRPEPPSIVDASSRYTDDELFAVVENGVRYTGMPAWPVSNRPDEVWSMVAFIKAMPGMDRDAYLRMARGNLNQARPPVPEGSVTATEQATAAALQAFIPSNRERPYLPGDAQDFTSTAALSLPRTGFGSEVTGDVMASCAACHGADGSGRAGGAFPNLTLQSPQYIYDALVAFATGQRQSGIMWEVAANLSDAQMRAVAARIGTPAPVATQRDHVERAGRAARVARGAEIASSGVTRDQGAAIQNGVELPAKVERCSSCHVAGVYLDQVIPRIDGQNAAYLRMQMHAFRAGGRGDTGSYNPMVGDSHNLSDSDIAAVADYYESRAPMPKN